VSTTTSKNEPEFVNVNVNPYWKIITFIIGYYIPLVTKLYIFLQAKVTIVNRTSNTMWFIISNLLAVTVFTSSRYLQNNIAQQINDMLHITLCSVLMHQLLSLQY
jgi:hypothetical protein